MSNDFLPFGTAAGSNVLSQAAYAALPAVASGYASGVALSQQLNKTWRQASVISWTVAQFIADTLGQNVADDANLTKILSQFKSAIASAAAAAQPGSTVPVNTAQTVDGSKNGNRYVTQAAVAFTLAASTVLNTGFQCTIMTYGGPATINVASGDYANGTLNGVVIVPRNRECRILSDGNGNIFIDFATGLITVPSAGTVDLGAQKGHNLIISGTTPITSFGSSAPAGTPYTVIFSGAVQIVYNAVSQIVPGRQSFVTAINDVAVIMPLGGGNNQIISYQRASGLSLVSTPAAGAYVQRQVIRVTSTTQVTAAFDNAILVNATGSYVQDSSPSPTTISTASAGLNGLDIGTIQPISWYALYRISDGLGNSGYCLSLSFTRPDNGILGTYPYYVRQGVVRTGSGGNLLTTTQLGRSGQYAANQVMASGGSGGATILTSSLVPPTASRIKILLSNVGGSAGNIGGYASASPYTAGYGLYVGTSSATSGYVPMAVTGDFVNDTGFIYYTANSNAPANLYCIGWEDNV